MLEFERRNALPDDLLMKVDKMTMAHSVEARVPYLDNNIADFSASVQSSLKLRGFTDKYILRLAAQTLVPKKMARRKKRRFFVPIDEWFSAELLEFSKHMLDGLETPYKQNYIDKMFRNFHSSPLYYSRQLWCILTYEIWKKMYIDDIGMREIAKS